MTPKTLIFFILSGFLSILPFTVEAGVLQDNNCNSCHRLNTEETGKVFTAPDLHYAGNKFQPEWLKQFLKKPSVIRTAGFITDPGFLQGVPENLPPHPSFPEKEAVALANSLMDLKISGPTQEPVPTELISKGQRARIKYQFERTYGCISCHQSLNLVGKVRGGISGPSLVNAGNRLQADWIASWLKTPEAYLSKSRMPRYKMDVATQNLFAQFLMTLKNENMK
jgi:cytochrome c551/c552